MTRQVTMGFEAGTIDVLTSYSGASIDNLHPRTGDYNVYLDGTDSFGLITAPLNMDETFLRVGVLYHAHPGGGSTLAGGLIGIIDGWGVWNLTLGVDRNTNLLVLVRGNLFSGTPLAIGSTPISFDNYYCIEMNVIVNDAGMCQVKVDGFLDIDFVGDTSDGGTTNVRAVCFGYGGHDDSSPEVCFDDIAINDALGAVNNTWIGRGGIYPIVPDGVGNYIQLHASAGNAWDCINETPPSDLDYVYDDTVNQKSTYSLTDLAPATGTIDCINVIMRAQLDAVGTGNIARLIRSNAVDSQGADVGLDVSPKMIQENIETDPSGGGAWTIARINALEAGAVIR